MGNWTKRFDADKAPQPISQKSKILTNQNQLNEEQTVRVRDLIPAPFTNQNQLNEEQTTRVTDLIPANAPIVYNGKRTNMVSRGIPELVGHEIKDEIKESNSLVSKRYQL